MRVLKWCWALAALGAVGPDRGFAPTTAGPDEIAWRPDYDAAMKEAADSKKPVWIAFIMENETANTAVKEQHFHDEEIVKLSKRFVCLLANVARFPEIDRRAQLDFMNSPRISAPQFIFTKPDGHTVLVRHVWMLSPNELAKKMKKALALMLDDANADDAEKSDRARVGELLVEADGNNALKRAGALNALASTDDPRIVDFFIKQTAENVDETKRFEAVFAMGGRGNGNAAVFPVLQKLLSSGSQRIKIAAAISLEKLAMPESGPALAKALQKEAKDRVKAALVRALAVCDGVTPAHRKLVVAMAKAGGQTERTAAIRALADLAPDAESTAALLAGLKDGSNPVRAVAYYTVVMKNNVPGALALVEKQAPTEKSNDLRVLSAAALGALKGEGYDDKEAADKVKSYLTDEDLRKEQL
jgi:hypothetical protein